MSFASFDSIGRKDDILTDRSSPVKLYQTEIRCHIKVSETNHNCTVAI